MLASRPPAENHQPSWLSITAGLATILSGLPFLVGVIKMRYDQFYFPMHVDVGVIPAIFLFVSLFVLIPLLAQHILRKRVKKVWLFAIVFPITILALHLTLPFPNRLERLSSAIHETISEPSFLEFASDVRRNGFEDPMSGVPGRIVISGDLLSRMPAPLRSGIPPFAYHETDHVDLRHRVSDWGIRIYDRKNQDRWQAPKDTRFVKYKKVYDTVWAYRTSYPD